MPVPHPSVPFDAEALIRRIARQQFGVVTREQCRSMGISPRVERTRVAQGRWGRRGRALIIHDLVVSGDFHEAWLLQAEVGPEAIVSGPLAARLGDWNIEGKERIVVLCDHDKNAPPGIRVLRRENPAWPVQPTRLRLATPLDALADTAICRPFTQACRLIDYALQHHWIDPESFDELIGHRAGHGRRGVGRLRMLRERVISGSRSEAEQKMSILLKRTGTGSWKPNYPVLNTRGRIIAELDFALVSDRIAIEVDGRAFHSDDMSFERDRLRQNHLTTRGWTVLRFTWKQITTDPAAVVDTVRESVQRARRNSG